MKQKRDVILIDDATCNGCGQCVPNCPEGAIRIIDGKARLVGDLFCDGLGACLGHCPQGAITVEHRAAASYDEERVMANIVKGGPAVIAAHLEHLAAHGQDDYLAQARSYLHGHKIPLPAPAGHAGACGCPGGKTMVLHAPRPRADDAAAAPASELRQWPVQLQLLNPRAPYFADADLVVAADCVPFACADFHQRFLKGKALIIFCPKLDQTIDAYVAKLTELFTHTAIRSVSVVHMEVPCCFGVRKIVEAALQAAGKDVPLTDHTISLQGTEK
jgi:ferredoxin